MTIFKLSIRPAAYIFISVFYFWQSLPTGTIIIVSHYKSYSYWKYVNKYQYTMLLFTVLYNTIQKVTIDLNYLNRLIPMEGVQNQCSYDINKTMFVCKSHCGHQEIALEIYSLHRVKILSRKTPRTNQNNFSCLQYMQCILFWAKYMY